MVLKKWVESIQTVGYNGARTVYCSMAQKFYFDANNGHN